MANRKNQHFVPKSVLKPWTLNSEGKSITLYNVASGRLIESAPVKNQCSKDYFYGRDGIVEDMLGAREGVYAEILKSITSSQGGPRSAEMEIMRDFVLLQNLRTERAINEEAHMLRDIYGNIFQGPLPEDVNLPTQEEIVKSAIARWIDVRSNIRDLKGVIVHNESEIPFVISDDPAIHTNKLHIQRLNSNKFGLTNSGAILTMPISPWYAALYYDGSIYTIPDKVGFSLKMRRPEDIVAMNDFQLLKSNQNIYMSDTKFLEQMRVRLEEIGDLRLPVSFELSVFDPIEGRPDSYRRRKGGVEVRKGEHFIAIERVYFRPPTWPSQLRYRTGMHGFSNGSSAGIVRRAAAAEAKVSNIRKVRLK